MDRPLILVAGATGNQGGAVVDALLEHSDQWRVRALTRDPAGAPGKALAARGVEVVAGDMADKESLKQTLKGAYGVFGVQNSRTAGLTGEVRQGITLVDAARAAGVEHFVYASVGGVERVRGIPHFDTKWEIEQHLRAAGLPATVLRPTTFMDVFTMRGASVGLGMMAAALGPRKSLQMVAVRDIGVFAQLAFEQPGTYTGQVLELAGDQLTVPDIAATLKAAGRPGRYARVPRVLLRAMGKEARMLFWLGESGYDADIPALRKQHPGLLTLKTWLAQTSGLEAA
ncbi:NmrA/HSCARG family protein [Planobispora siamensis]|uniref:NmrA family transcriptional regulator n=1 Tax=Planobispora siamensis TaxID=936338 RepID=A0A8J3SRR6_9ACTN|nr:NmrA/HSCARG family protein [Planobispora siamensis]GIH97671.1 NmrA family transcriptional regulator [Planobispora siamensis]